MNEITVTFSQTTYKVRELREDETTFSVWGSYSTKESAQASIDVHTQGVLALKGHTYKVIKVQETITEEVLED